MSTSQTQGAVGKTAMTKQETEMAQVIGVGHVALSARDPVALAEFYSDVLGLSETNPELHRVHKHPGDFC